MENKTCIEMLTGMKNHIKAELGEACKFLEIEAKGYDERFSESIKIFIFIRSKLKELAEHIDSAEVEYLKLEEKLEEKEVHI